MAEQKKFFDEYVKYHFTEPEKRDIAMEMARKISDLQAAEDRKKAINSQIKSEVDTMQAEINAKATMLNNGYEMRLIKCAKEPDWQNGVWLIIRQDNFDTVREVAMTAEDKQMQIEDQE